MDEYWDEKSTKSGSLCQNNILFGAEPNMRLSVLFSCHAASLSTWFFLDISTPHDETVTSPQNFRNQLVMQHHIPVEMTSHSYCCKNLKTQIQKKSQCRSTLDHQSQFCANYRGVRLPPPTPTPPKKVTVQKTNILHKRGVQKNYGGYYWSSEPKMLAPTQHAQWNINTITN